MKEFSRPKIILIGGTSHTGKSTLGKTLAAQLNGTCVATDSLARHPGRPWTSPDKSTIKSHVAQHYLNLTVPELVEDVLAHYRQNVMPQIETLIQIHQLLLDKYLVIEGSAIYPSFVNESLGNQNIVGIWLVGDYTILEKRIYASSDFYTKNRTEQHLIGQFLGRTWLFNQRVVETADRSATIIDVSDRPSNGELMNQCLSRIR